MMGAMAFVEAKARMRLKRATATAWSVALPIVFVLMTGGSLVSLEEMVMFPRSIIISSRLYSRGNNRRM